MENFWVQIAEEASAHGARCHLIYPKLNSLPDSIAESPIHVAEVDFNARPLALLRYIRAHQIGVVYLSDKSFLSSRNLLLRLAGVRTIIIHDHTPGERTRPGPFKRLAKKFMHSLPVVTADLILAVTPYVGNRHIEATQIPSRKSRVVKNGIIPIGRDDSFKDYCHQVFGIPREASIVLSASRASIYKRVDFLIDCADVLVNQDKRDNLYFVFCGDGPDLVHFKTLAADRGLSDRFFFAGRRDDVRKIAQSCSIGVQASRGEVGYSLSILEYMSAGLATVVHDNPSVCASIEDEETGLVFREGDVESACSQIRRVLDDEGFRLELGRNAQLAVEWNYNLSSTNESLRQVFEAVFKGMGLTLQPDQVTRRFPPVSKSPVPEPQRR